jgi:hypothetical protein
MSQDEAVVNDEVVTQDTTAADSTPAENNSPEVVEDDVDTSGYDDDGQSDTESKPTAPAEKDSQTEVTEETKDDTQPRDGAQELTPKSQNRFQELANRNRELEQRLAEVKARESQFAAEQGLLNEINPETGEYYTPQEIERVAWQQSREQQAQQVAQERYNLEVQHNQQTISAETEKALQDFPMFNEKSPEYNPQLAQLADARIGRSLITNEQGQIIGAYDSPYEILKTIADATTVNAARYEAQAQKATEKMLANADTGSSATNAKSKSVEDEAFEAYDAAI